jgi:hypothetical protein
MVIFSTSEAEAREGERKDPPSELKAQMEEMNALSMGAPEALVEGLCERHPTRRGSLCAIRIVQHLTSNSSQPLA